MFRSIKASKVVVRGNARGTNYCTPAIQNQVLAMTSGNA